MCCVSTVHWVFSLNVYVLDNPKVNSLCYSTILIPWFLMNYKGRVLQQITDRMVSYNSLSCIYSWIFHTSPSQYFITLWSQTLSVLPPVHSDTTNPCKAFVVLSMSKSLPPPLQLLPGVCKTDGPGCIRKLSWSWIVAWFKFRSDGIFVCS